ncbi:hypothetical protein KY338_03720 [Candidatus Woesearchaeota archaeon]|nr:hypothetical protein [Candidatus Woesearchaeota archaeon]MBW3005420.1 hypothetical protein [Candidatus Woesearchaeota archaeon]
MGKTYDIDANAVLALLKEAKQRNASVSIGGKTSAGSVEGEDVDFGIGLISAPGSCIDRSTITGIHEVVDDGETESHKITLRSEIPPYELEIKYSLSDEYHGGIFGLLGVLKDVSKAILHMRD